jgi:hypothetical protein
MKADVESVLNGYPPAATAFLPGPMIESAEVEELPDGSMDRRNAGRLIASMTALLLVMAGASAFGFYKSDRPEAAAVTATEVPAVLGLGQVGVESLLRNADLVPRFKFVHGAEGASVDTAIRQSPRAGGMAAVNSTVVVVINMGPQREAIQPSLVGRDLDFRPAIRQPIVTGYSRSSPNDSGASYRGQERQSDHESERSTGHKINKKFGKGNRGTKDR